MIVARDYFTPLRGTIRYYEGHEVEGEAPNRVLRVGHGPVGPPESILSNPRIETIYEEVIGTEEFEARLAMEEARSEWGYYR